MTEIVYATREDVKDALDFKETARANGRIDRALRSASRSVEGLCHRRFYPELATRYFDWPSGQRSRPWRLWLDDNELISVTTLSSGGETIAPGDYFLRRSDDRDEPPYTHIEIDLDSSAAFSSGDTHQRAIVIAGLFGYWLAETSVGATAEALDAAETGVDVTAAASATVGVGSILRIGDERMIVTGRAQLDTGQNLASDIDAQMKTHTVQVADGTGYAIGETLLLDAERMRVDDIAGNSLVVTRAWDGSTLAAHTTGADIYAPRTLTVERGALGTTAATHDTAATVWRFDPPGPVRSLTVAEALNELLQGSSGYARTVGSGENQRESSGKGLADLRKQVYVSHGRKARLRAV